MPTVPTWRKPAVKMQGHSNANWALELHRKPWTDPSIKKCKKIAKSTGKRCMGVAVRGSDYCNKHGGMSGLDNRIKRGDGNRIYNNGRKNSSLKEKSLPARKSTVSDRLLNNRIIHNNFGSLRNRFNDLCSELNQLDKELSRAVRTYLSSFSLRAKVLHLETVRNRKIDPRSWYELLKAIRNKDL